LTAQRLPGTSGKESGPFPKKSTFYTNTPMVHTQYLGILALSNGLPGNLWLWGQAGSVQLAVLFKVQFFHTRTSPAARTGAPQLSLNPSINPLRMFSAMNDLQLI